MRFLTLSHTVYLTASAEDLVTAMREASWTPSPSDKAFMRAFARRARVLRPSAVIRTTDALTFISDLEREGFLLNLDGGPKPKPGYNEEGKPVNRTQYGLTDRTYEPEPKWRDQE